MKKIKTGNSLIAIAVSFVMLFTLLSQYQAKAADPDDYAGYVYFTVEELTLGQGVLINPVRVGVSAGETMAELTQRFLGPMSTYTGDMESFYLTGVIDDGEPEGWTKNDIPAKTVAAAGGIDKFGQRAEADTLSAGDYHEQSGWMLSLNNAGLSAGASAYTFGSGETSFKDGDVIRLQFSAYGWGADTNMAWDEPIYTCGNKDELIKTLADYSYLMSTDAYRAAYEVYENLEATDLEIADACAALKAEAPSVNEFVTKDGRPDVSKIGDCILYLTFDNNTSGLEYKSGSKTVKATANGTSMAFVDDAAAGEKGLYMKDGNDSYYKLAYSDGSALINGYDELTISYWSKSIGSTATYYGWTYFCKNKNNGPEVRDYIGAVDRWDRMEVERCNGTVEGQDPARSNAILIDSQTTGKYLAKWKYVTIVYELEATKVYINGELVDQNECPTHISSYLNGDSEFFLGYSPWGDSGEFYQGYIDEYSIMKKAFSADEVKSLFNTYSFNPETAPTIEPSPTPSPTPLPTPTKTPRPTKTPKPATETPKATEPAKDTATAAPDNKATTAPAAQATPTAPAANAPAAGTVTAVNGSNYKVLSDDSVAYTGPTAKTIKKAVVPGAVTIEGKEYKVTEISDNAFTKCKNLTKVTIGANVTRIGKKAFAKCPKLKAVLVQSAGIASVGKSAFSGIAKKAMFTFPKAKFANYKKKVFKGKGQKKTCKYKKK